MEPREFHIWNFPEGKTRILFKNHEKFIDNATDSFVSQKALANFLDITPELLSMWKRNYLYIPLSVIKKIVDKLKLNWSQIEENVLSYKGVSTGIPIKNPKFPIKESPKMFELITHIICDGSVNKNGIPSYINSNKNLINNLQNILKEIFGEVKGKLYSINKNDKLYYEYRFPKIIVELLEHFYGTPIYRVKEFPSVLLYLPKKFWISVIRAFADDEGSVDLNYRICFSSTNKNTLEILVKLLKEKLKYRNISDIKLKGKSYYYFYIKPKDIERYQKEIGFAHPEKIDRLRKIVFIRSTGYKPGQHAIAKETKEKILKLLNGKILSTYQIMKEVKINKSNVNIHIKRLINEGFILQHHKEGQVVFWTRRK